MKQISVSYYFSVCIQFVIKNILLHDTSHAMIPTVRETSPVMLVKYLTDMGINRKCIHMMQCKKTNAVCYLFPHAAQFHKFLLRTAIITESVDSLQRNLSVQNTTSRLSNITCPVPHSQFTQLFFRCARKLLWSRKCVIFLFAGVFFLSICFAQPLYTP